MTEAKQTGIIAQNEAKKAKTPQTTIEWVNAYLPQIKKALPEVITPERFTRITLSALSNNPQLQKCDVKSFLGAMLNAAQLGLEPNTPLGQAYLIPYGKECQFQIGYKGLIDLAYRTGQIKTIQAHIVYANDEFDFEYGLDSKLKHKPTTGEKGKPIYVYALFKLQNGGEAFEVMSWEEAIKHAEKHSPSYNAKSSPWKTHPEEMAKKTVLKRVLKYAPLSSEFIRAASTDEQSFEFDATAKEPELVLNPETGEVIEEEAEKNEQC